MHWESFYKGTAFSLFLIFFSLTMASLAYQIRPQAITQVPIKYGQFPTVLAASVSAVPKEELKPVNILLLGLDSRKGDSSARCDSIHMFSFRPDIGKIIITSAPRGTFINETEYISNVCSIYGFERAQKEIEKITDVKADYVVRVGFSQVQGLLRLAGLPPSPTLQLLRDRKDYLIGDNQRSYNQAMFFKDSIIGYTDWVSKLPWPVQKMGFNMIEADLSFDQAKKIFEDILTSGIYKDPNNIEIKIRPKDGLIREDIHIQSLVPTNNDWQNDPEFKDYQNDVKGYLTAIVNRTNALSGKKQYNQANSLLTLPLKQKLWLQIENETERNQLHYLLVEAFVYSSTDYDKSKSLLGDFILEMEAANETEFKSKAQELLKLL